MPINIRHVIIETIIQLSDRGLSDRKMSRMTEVSQCDISKVLRHVRDQYQQSYPGVTWASVEDDYMKRRLCPSPYDKGEQVSYSIQDQGGADQANLTPYHCLRGQFSSGWISLKGTAHLKQHSY